MQTHSFKQWLILPMVLIVTVLTTGAIAAYDYHYSFFLPGDVNNDGFVDDNDLNIVIAFWGLSGVSRSQGDLDGNGLVGGSDYREVLAYWGADTAVPEPSTLGLLSLGAWALLRRKRGHSPLS